MELVENDCCIWGDKVTNNLVGEKLFYEWNNSLVTHGLDDASNIEFAFLGMHIAFRSLFSRVIGSESLPEPIAFDIDEMAQTVFTQPWFFLYRSISKDRAWLYVKRDGDPDPQTICREMENVAMRRFFAYSNTDGQIENDAHVMDMLSKWGIRQSAGTFVNIPVLKTALINDRVPLWWRSVQCLSPLLAAIENETNLANSADLLPEICRAVWEMRLRSGKRTIMSSAQAVRMKEMIGLRPRLNLFVLEGDHLEFWKYIEGVLQEL